jgi:excisionase family DNA binding protein
MPRQPLQPDALPEDLAESFSTPQPTPRESQLARAARERLAKVHRPNRPLRIVGDDQDAIEVPAVVAQLLERILGAMSAGNAVTLIPIHAELTTQQAADMLGVSRPFLIKQLDEGRIPFRKVGSHRRVRFDDLMSYKSRTDHARQQSLDALTAASQALGVGY